MIDLTGMLIKHAGEESYLLRKKISTKAQLRERARLLFYNTGLSNREIAEQLECSMRTIIRWKQRTIKVSEKTLILEKVPRHRTRRYDPAIFARIEALKAEHPEFTAPIIERQIKGEFEGSLSVRIFSA